MIQQNFQPPTNDEIARYAYHLWESEGRVHGRALDYWLQAEAHLKATRAYEAGLLNRALQEEGEKKSKAPNASVSTPKPARKRLSRLTREAEPVCA